MGLENLSDHRRDINTEASKKSTKNFIKQQHITLDTPTEHLRERIDKTPIDFLTPEERQAFKSGDEKSKKKELAKQIYDSAQLMKTLRRTDSEIEEFVNFSVRSLREYKEHYGDAASSSQHQREINEASSSQQHIEIIELSDSEEDVEKSPQQKQPSESRTHEREKWQSDQAQEETSPNTGQRIDSATHQYQLYEQQQSKGKELDPMEIHDKIGSSDYLRLLDQFGQGLATLTEQHEVHDQADPRHQTSDHLRPHDQQTAPDNENKKPIDFLKPEERQNFASGTAESIKKKLAAQILHFATTMKALSHADSEIDHFLNTVPREWPLYKLHYGNGASSSQHQGEINEGSLPQHQGEINEGSSSQQHIEIIELSDSEEDVEKSPQQKQPSESRTHEREKWQSDQAQEETSPNTGQRIDSATHQYQLYEQQQSKGKELDPMEIHDKIGSSDYLRLLDQFGQGLATLTEQHEVHDQADPTRQADASSHSDHLGVGLDAVFESVESRDSKVEELNKEIEKCKVYPEKRNLEIKEKREKIAKIYHKNKSLVSDHIENIIKDLRLRYQQRFKDDLWSEYSKTPIGDFLLKFSEMSVNNLIPEYKKRIENDLFSEHNKKSINDSFSKYKEEFINGLISEYKEGIKGAQSPEEVKKIEGEFISNYTSKGFDTKSSEELIQLVREINNLQGSIQANQRLIPYYEKQREKILLGRNETSNQAEASSPADHLEASLDNFDLDLEFGDLEFREPHDKIQATSSHTNARSESQIPNEGQQAGTTPMEVVPQNATWYQSFSEIQQPFAAHNATEAQHESTSQQADVRRQDQIEQRQDTIVQQHERYDQAGLRSEEEIKHRLRTFVANLMQEKKRLTENRVKGMLNQYNIYTKEDLRHYYNCVRELYNEESYEPLRQRYGSISFHIRQQLTQRQ